MFKLFKKWWKYLTAKLTGSFEERADPKVQLEQAIAEAQNQHRRLREQAANVIANQKQGELRLNAKIGELEKLNANARQALIMAADAEKAGDADEGDAVHVGRRDDRQPADPGREGRREPEDDGPRVDPGVRPGEGGGAAEQPAPAGEDRREVEAAVAARPGEDAGGDELGDGPAQRERRRRRADVCRGPGEDPGPLRQGQGDGRATETSVESRVLEVEQATANVEAQSRLSELRAELGLEPAAAAPQPRWSSPPSAPAEQPPA